LNGEIDELKKKKRCLQTGTDSLTTSADEYTEKAEQTHQKKKKKKISHRH